MEVEDKAFTSGNLAGSDDSPAGKLPIFLSIVLGGLFGASLGAVSGAAHCFFSYDFDAIWSTAKFGATIGLPIGVVFLIVRSRMSDGLAGFSLLGFCFGLVPGFQWFVGPEYHEGAAFAFLAPVISIFLGAFFDRGIDALRRGRKGNCVTALSLGFAAVASSIWILDNLSYGEEPRTLANAISRTVEEQLNEGLAVDAYSIGSIALTRTGRCDYVGTVEAIGPNGPETFDLFDVHDDGREYSWLLLSPGDE